MVITKDVLSGMKHAYDKNPVMKAASLAIAKQPVDEVAFDRGVKNNVSFIFNHEVKTMAVTNQKSSGRCWLFAALNLFREIAAKKLNVGFFELSQNFIAYYDKLEKANYFLEAVMEIIGCPKDDRLYTHILQTGIQDGGQWDMMVNLVKKYGLVPKSAMPETFQSENTRSLNSAINILLRRAAAQMRHAYKNGADENELKRFADYTLESIHALLTAGYGCPPEKFDYEYIDKDGKYVRLENLTPESFFKDYIGFDFDSYISLIHSPTDDKPFERNYTVRFLGNVVEGAPVRYLNVDMDVIKNAVMRTIDSGESVWFGSDVGWFMERSDGLLLNNLTDLNTLFGGIDFETDKEDMLDARMSAMDHAMTITGYHEVNGKPVRWKIQNSWGSDKGDKGYYVMDDKWFDNFVYQAVVNRKYVPAEIENADSQETIVLDPWDPMGTLAE